LVNNAAYQMARSGGITDRVRKTNLDAMFWLSRAAMPQLRPGWVRARPRRRIRVNAAAPGPIWTPLIPATMPTTRSIQAAGRPRS